MGLGMGKGSDKREVKEVKGCDLIKCDAAKEYGATNRGVQRHPRRRKMRHRNPRGGTKIRKLGGQSLKLLPSDVIFKG